MQDDGVTQRTQDGGVTQDAIVPRCQGKSSTSACFPSDTYHYKCPAMNSVRLVRITGFTDVLAQLLPILSGSFPVCGQSSPRNQQLTQAASERRKTRCIKVTFPSSVTVLSPVHVLQIMKASFAGSGKMLCGTSSVSQWCLGEEAAEEALRAFEECATSDSVTAYRLQSLKPASLRHMGSSLTFLGHHVAVHCMHE